MEIVFEPEPHPATRAAILDGLIAYNAAQTDHRFGSPRNIAIALRDPETGASVGGLTARIGYSRMFVELLYVPEPLRGQRLGEKLMQEAEAVARREGCTGIWLDTFSFQARASIASSAIPNSAASAIIRRLFPPLPPQTPELTMVQRVSTGSPSKRPSAIPAPSPPRGHRLCLGHHGYDYATMTMPESVGEQAKNALATIDKALKEAGSSIADTVRVVYYVGDVRWSTKSSPPSARSSGTSVPPPPCSSCR